MDGEFCRWPNGLRKFFRLKMRRRCCGGVAHECTVTSAKPVIGGGRMLCKMLANGIFSLLVVDDDDVEVGFMESL